MKEIILEPQKSDMGNGTGKYEFSSPITLKTVLKWLQANLNDWGTITIYYKDFSILRKFDYDIYNNKYFYYNLSWELSILVKEINFSYCFINRDIEIILEK